MQEEYFPVVDDFGIVIKKASRTSCHSGSKLLHPVVHLHVFNSKGQLYLQKRAENKDTQPGKWDTSVGGHILWGESLLEALIREANEELNIRDFHAEQILQYNFESDFEYELVYSFITTNDQSIINDPIEIQEGRFWDIREIIKTFGSNRFTPNFEQEFKMMLHYGLIKHNNI